MSSTASYTVRGMTCDHCASSVTAEINQLPGVTDVEVDIASGRVTVTSDSALPAPNVREAVEEAGYALADTAS